MVSIPGPEVPVKLRKALAFLGVALLGVPLAARASADPAAAWPTSQLYGRNFLGLPAGSRKLALTYDDGPNDPYTLQLLDVLASHNARATFFLVGQICRAAAGHRPRHRRRRTRCRESHLVASVPDLGYACGSCDGNLNAPSKPLRMSPAQAPALFRPPFGGRRPGTFGLRSPAGHDADHVASVDLRLGGGPRPNSSLIKPVKGFGAAT